MSKLLIDDYPLMVLPRLATTIGLNESIFLQQLHYWLISSKHEKDGRKWVYNTLKQWGLQFPFWSERTIARITSSLTKQGLLLIGNYNRRGGDQTKWYSIDYDAVEKLTDVIKGPPDDSASGSNPDSERDTNEQLNNDDSGNSNLPDWQTATHETMEEKSIHHEDTVSPIHQNGESKLSSRLIRTGQNSRRSMTTCHIASANMAEPLPESNSKTHHKDNGKTTTTAAEVFLPEETTPACESLLLFALKIDMSKSVMLRCIEKYGQDFVLKQTELLRKNLRAGKKIQNPSGWLITALKEEYQDSTGKNYAYITDEEKAARRAAAEKRDREIRAHYEAQNKAEYGETALAAIDPNSPFARYLPKNRTNTQSN